MKRLISNKRGGTIGLMVSFLLLGLFAFALITFATQFASDNNANVSIASDTRFGATASEISQNVTAYYSDVNTSNKALMESTISSQTDSTEGGTAFKTGIWPTFRSAVSTINLSFKTVFGSDNGFVILTSSLIGALVFIVGLYIWKAWKGDPD